MPIVPRGYAPGRSALTGAGTDSGPRQVNLPSSGLLRGVLWFLGAPLLLIGPFLAYAAVFLATSETTMNRWILGVAGVGVTISCVKLARRESRLHERAQRDLRRLEAAGVTATAEITAVRPISLGEESGTELTLLISGPGFEPFESTSRCKDDSALTVGARLNAVVDPTDRLYAIVP
ncbi:hypothetical protein V6V47_07920 [Micromonospora sp. CPCC 205539]|uniref:hypothetical protein n=1 Tax=Micromonospora sp. CPCC 205539 TaxID=3122408 RepID=UPI002FF0AC62